MSKDRRVERSKDWGKRKGIVSEDEDEDVDEDASPPQHFLLSDWHGNLPKTGCLLPGAISTATADGLEICKSCQTQFRLSVSGFPKDCSVFSFYE